MSCRIRDGFANDLQDIEMETRGDSGVRHLGFEPAVELPMTPEPVAKRARLLGDLRKTDGILAQRRNRGPQILLLEQHQFLEVLKIGGSLGLIADGAADRVNPISRAGEELDNAIVVVS